MCVRVPFSPNLDSCVTAYHRKQTMNKKNTVKVLLFVGNQFARFLWMTLSTNLNVQLNIITVAQIKTWFDYMGTGMPLDLENKSNIDKCTMNCHCRQNYTLSCIFNL